MAIAELVMPKLGESIMEATILKWHKQVGEYVNQDETVLDIATDKVDSEVPSTAEGVITEILFKENEVVPIGTVIARISSEVNGSTSSAPAQEPATENISLIVEPVAEILAVEDQPIPSEAPTAIAEEFYASSPEVPYTPAEPVILSEKPAVNREQEPSARRIQFASPPGFRPRISTSAKRVQHV